MTLAVARKPLVSGATSITSRPGVSVGTSFNPNPYGVDIKCLDDLDPYFSLIGGVDVLAQDLYHLITSAPGTLPGSPGTPSFDSRFLLSQSVTQEELAAIQSNMTTVLQADERVQQALVALSYSNGTLTATVTIIPLNPQYSKQPFQFVASISTIGANLLSISAVPT